MKRVQLRYYQKLPENTKNVSRISRWGNPFKLEEHGGIYSLEDSLSQYKIWLEQRINENTGPGRRVHAVGLVISLFQSIPGPF